MRGIGLAKKGSKVGCADAMQLGGQNANGLTSLDLDEPPPCLTHIGWRLHLSTHSTMATKA